MRVVSLPMTRPRYSPGRPFGPPRVVVIHATAGRWPGDRDWLRKGGADDPRKAVSVHYLVAPDGETVQFVGDGDTAWHTGASAWTVDGVRISGSAAGVAALNWRSLGIELSHPNDGSPYPDAQIVAAIKLTQQIVQRHRIPCAHLVRHCDIAPGRKTDPVGFPWAAFVAAVYDDPLALAYTAESALILPPNAEPLGTLQQAIDWLTRRTTRYTPYDISTIVHSYAEIGRRARVDWFLALAQLAHETGNLTSALSARPTRNPAGIGITGASSPTPRNGYVWDSDRNLYRAACSFAAWTPEGLHDGSVSSVEAHLGRLLAWGQRPGERFGVQVELADKALRVRDLSLRLHGTAPVLRLLGAQHNPTGIGWADPGANYGGAIAKRANEMRGM